MKSQDNDDDDYLDDPIQLNFGVNASRMENLQFLDPGIIDLDCDSNDDDCKYIDEDTADINLLGGTASLHSVTTTISHRVKPMCIKLIDCYKFPWFFDHPTRNIIEKKLIINNSVKNCINEQMQNDIPKDLKKISDKCEVDSNSLCINVNYNNISRQMSGDLNESRNETDRTIDIKRVHEMFSTNFRVCEKKKRLVNSQKRKDMEIIKAISQRNITEVDLKKNKGLVGMKIQRVTTEKQTMGIKYKAKKQTQNNKEKSGQETLSKLYVQAVDKALVNLGTTITPVFDDATGNNKESEPSKCTSQDVNVTWDPKEFNSFTCNLIPATLESNESRKDFKHISAQKGNVEKDMATKINETTKIAEEIMRMSLQNKEKNPSKEKDKPDVNKNKLYKPMPYSKKIENERRKILMDGIQNSLKQQKNTEGCKMTKMIIPIPLSSKARKKEKNNNRIKQQNVINILKIKEPTKQESENLKTKKVSFINSASSTHTSDAYTPEKTFTTLNKFTENILNKIQAKQLQQFKTNKPEKLRKKRAKKISYIDQSKSTSECKLMLNETITKANTISKDLILDGEKVNSKAEKTSLIRSPTQLKHLKNNSPGYLQSKSYTDKLFQFTHHNATNTLPLNTIIMKTAKTDEAKIDEIASGTLVENTHSNTANHNNPVNESNTDTEHISIINTSTIKSRRQSSNVVSLGSKNNENCMKNKRTINKIPVLVKQPPERTNGQPVKDKFIIETIITNRNELDTAKHNSTHAASNSYVYTPKTQSSEIIIKPTQIQSHQAQANNPLNVHNSMQSHILYRPQTKNRQNPQIFPNSPETTRRHQTPAQQMNQLTHEPMCYATWYNEGFAHAAMNARTPTGVAGDIPAPVVSNTISPSGVIGGVSLQTAVNLRTPGDISTRMTLNGRSVPSGASRPVSPRVGLNTNSLSNSRGIPSYRVVNNTLYPGVKEVIPQQMGVNARSLGVNGGILPPAGNYGVIPQQIAMRERPTPPGICDVQPGNVFWSYAFPPPQPPPPPPPFPPLTQEATGSPCTSQTNSSIIGINNDGIIKKINIAAPVPVVDCNTKESIVKIENQEPDSTPLYGEVSTDGLESSALATTKSEMLHVLDTSMQRIQSPVKHLKDTFTIVSSQSPAYHLKKPLSQAGPIDLKNSLHPQSNERPAVNISKPELSQEVKSKKVTATNWKVPSFEFNSVAKNSKRTMPIELCRPNVCVKSSVINPTEVPPFKQLFEVNPRPINNTTNNITNPNESKLSHKTHSRPSIKPNEVSVSNSEREQRSLENNERPLKNTKRIDNASPVNLKRALPINETKDTSSTAKYKPGPLSKKMKINDPRESPNQERTKEKTLPSKGYSAPILPIPTYEKILSDIPSSNKHYDKPVEKNKKPIPDTITKRSYMNPDRPIKKQKQLEQNSNSIDFSKKISLDEYKKRSSERETDDETNIYNSKQKEKVKTKTVDMPRRESYVDSDLGYDSDSTVKL